MADDIDIEEHDILDNPHIRNIFPDLSVVKQEISEFLNEAVNVKLEPESSQSTPKQQPLLHSYLNTSNKVPSVLNEEKCIQQQNTTLQLNPYESNISFQRNKIIIGSKPSKPEKLPKTTDSDKNQVKIPILILHDVVPYLEKSKRYCKQCMILYPANSLCDHKRKMSVVKNITTKTSLNNQKGFECRLCHIRISTQSNLIRHYRNVHKKILKSINKNDEGSIVAKHTKNEAKSKDSVSQNYRKHQLKPYCKKCKTSFSSLNSLKRHNRNIHRDTEFITKAASIIEDCNNIIEEETIKTTRANRQNKIDTECFHCKKIFPDQKSLIDHVYEVLEPKTNQVNDRDKIISKEARLSNKNEVVSLRKEELDRKRNIESPIARNKNISHTIKPFKSKHSNTISNKNVAKINTRSKQLSKAVGKSETKRKDRLRSQIKNICPPTELQYDDESLKTTSKTINKNKTNIKVIDKNNPKYSEKENKYVYRCPHCSYCFFIVKNYMKHIKLKHNASYSKVAKKSFDPQCSYCEATNTNVTSHNRHLSQDHANMLSIKVTRDTKVMNRQVKVNNAKNNQTCFAFKSAIFKCVRCDINFVSAEAAKDHDGHMDILINWKCHICNLIFKSVDKKLHLKQHVFSNNITTHVLEAEALSCVLYNCTKCAIHFSEKSYVEHYQKCEIDTASSMYCKVCDILINKPDLKVHESAHKNMEDFSLSVITSDIIILDKFESESEKQKDVTDNDNHSTKKVINESLTYCPTCKCYMTYVRKIHSRRRCSQLIKHVCDICGLLMTAKCIDTHRKYHKNKDFNIQDLSFYDMDGNKIKPPVPEYPQCGICKVYFPSKVEIISHICKNTQYSTCPICEKKLSEVAFKLHMPYHDYKLQSKNQMNIKLPTTNKTTKIPSKSKIKKSMSNNIITTPGEANIKSTSKYETVAPAQSHPNNVNFYKIQEISHKNNAVAGRLTNTQTTDLENIHIESSNDDDYGFVIIYTCKSCLVTLDSYDKVVEHCQKNEKLKKKCPSILKSCPICRLKFEFDKIESHKNIHETDKPIKNLIFDLKYFSFDNKVWLNHVFQSLSTNLVEKIIGKSVYKDEHRLKLLVVQPGLAHLTVYKCAKCCNFIDTDILFKHAGCKNPNIRSIPCSKCGLTFLSTVSRNQHQIIHARCPDIDINSYNIVLFNINTKQTSITEDNIAPRQYILYQCRNCNEVTKKKEEEHLCTINDLKKCSECGLLLRDKEFNNHVDEHQNSSDFCPENMKVILTGKQKIEDTHDSTLTPTFNGLIYDYTLYQCKHCEICVKNEHLIAKHVCVFGIYRFQCHKCDYYFTEKAHKPHLKTHSIDSEFKRDNINIVPFDLTRDTSKNTVKQIEKIATVDESNEQDDKMNDNYDENQEKENNEDTGISDKGKEQDNRETENVVTNNEPETQPSHEIILYKCKCELHFVDKLNALQHYKKCSPKQRSFKQNCPKCNLTFNPSELFSHLVNHHGDKNVNNYKHNVKEITDEMMDGSENTHILVDIYKCSKCDLHFVKNNIAERHFHECPGDIKDREACFKCNTTFDKTSFDLKEHSAICGKGYKIVVVDETKKSSAS